MSDDRSPDDPNADHPRNLGLRPSDVPESQEHHPEATAPPVSVQATDVDPPEFVRIEGGGRAPRGASTTVTDMLRILTYGFRHRANDPRFWLEVPPRPELVEALAKSLQRLPAVRWKHQDGIERTVRLKPEDVELIRESGVLHLSAHLVERYAAAVTSDDLVRFANRQPARFAKQAEVWLAGARERIQSRQAAVKVASQPSDFVETPAERFEREVNVHALRTDIEHREAEVRLLDQLIADYESRDTPERTGRPRKVRSRRTPRAIFDRLLERIQRREIWKDLQGVTEERLKEAAGIEQDGEYRPLAARLLFEKIGFSLDDDATRRVQAALWGSGVRRARSPRTLALALVASALGLSVRRMREHLKAAKRTK